MLTGPICACPDPLSSHCAPVLWREYDSSPNGWPPKYSSSFPSSFGGPAAAHSLIAKAHSTRHFMRRSLQRNGDGLMERATVFVRRGSHEANRIGSLARQSEGRNGHRQHQQQAFGRNTLLSRL